jgi:alkaline phosphatase
MKIRFAQFLAIAVLHFGFPGLSRAVDGVVLVIADGTSMELLTTARIYQYGVKGQLELEKMPATAFVRTYSANDIVTDSSASATAMARGAKARNGAVGIVDSAEPSIFDVAKKAGWSAAIITDDEINGGTPAPFLVEHGNRNELSEIAGKMIPQFGRRVDIAVGGGTAWFRDLPEEGFSDDIREAVLRNSRALDEAGIRHIENWQDYVNLAATSNASVREPILATFWPRVFPYIADRDRTPRLVDMTEQTVKLLRARKQPFLLVVEAALPDKAAHGNHAVRAIREVLELDAAVGWLLRNLTPKTLLLVTTDHTTGGLTLNGYIPHIVRGDALLGINPTTGNSYLTWASGPGGKPDANTGHSTIPGEDGSETTRVGRVPSDPDYVQPALIPRDSALHAGGDVWLLGSGPGSEAVHGFLDNTDIYRIMKGAIGN